MQVINKVQVSVGRDAKTMNLLYRLNPRWATRFMFNQMGDLLPDPITDGHQT